MKRLIVLLAAAGSLCCFAACHKTCTCQGYDLLEYSYTPEEVESLGGSCEELIYLGGTRYYSYCFWE